MVVVPQSGSAGDSSEGWGRCFGGGCLLVQLAFEGGPGKLLYVGVVVV